MFVQPPTWPEEFAKRYRENGCWRGETFGGMLRERAASLGNKTAITYADTHISYQELDQRVSSLAAGFHQLGIQKGSRVVVQLPNIPAFLKSFSLYFESVLYPSSRCHLIEAVKSLILLSLPKQTHMSYQISMAALIIDHSHVK